MLIASLIRYCEWLGGTQVDASTHEAGTSPSSFITASSARTICERARAEGFWFVRKMGDGTEASVQAVVLGSTRRDGYRTYIEPTTRDCRVVVVVVVIVVVVVSLINHLISLWH